MFNGNYIPAFWYSSNNFGDALTPYLIRKLSGKTPVQVDAKAQCRKVMVTGSILNNDVSHCVVWGAGLANSTDVIPYKEKICAVRGRLTYEKLYDEAKEKCAIGDPALLLPQIYIPTQFKKKWRLGIIPHYVDTKYVYDCLTVSDETLEKEGIKLIDINQDVEQVIDQIANCEQVVSSSLHGLITAHAYGIPALWAKFTNGIGGDDFKYKDYFSTTTTKDPIFKDYRGNFSFQDAIDLTNTGMIAPEIDINLDKLYLSCPFLKSTQN